MLVLISYDIEDDTVRTRLAKDLKDFGPRVQYSVFEADITQNELEKLIQVLNNVELGQTDSIRLYKICAFCFKNIEIWGHGEITKDKEYHII
ncbi:CRISPR-associated endonuclease Cas2 [candidate division KSB1 bacterium]|nr:CRISPR-associated endonuclease Cas2 [candidate division KSB1 bacterium]